MSELIEQPHGGALKPWPKGVSGNPQGRKSGGAYVKEWANSFYEQKLDEYALRKIAKDPKEEPARKTAAVQILHSFEYSDIADFEAALDGQKSLKELRGDGVNTAVVKKTKTKRREIPNGDNAPIIEVEREIELHDRSGAAFDRIMDRTEGGVAKGEVQVTVNMPVSVRITSPLSRERERLDAGT